MLVGGAVLTGLAASDHSDLVALSAQPGTPENLTRYDRTLSRMEGRETAAWAMWITGGVAVVTGLLIGVVSD